MGRYKQSKYDSGLSRRELKDIGRITGKYARKKSIGKKIVKLGLIAIMAYTSNYIGKQEAIEAMRNEEQISKLEETVMGNETQDYQQSERSEDGNLDNELTYGSRLQKYFSQRNLQEKKYE